MKKLLCAFAAAALTLIAAMFFIGRRRTDA